MDFGAELKMLRESRGLTQQELSDRTHVPINSLRKIEQGVYHDTTLSVGFRLAEALHVPLDRLGFVAEAARRCREGRKAGPDRD